LTPVQLNFFENNTLEPNRFNHGMILNCENTIDINALQAAWKNLLLIHGSLRTRFYQENQKYQQQICDTFDAQIDCYNLTDSNDFNERFSAIAEHLHGSLSLSTGKLTAVAYLQYDKTRSVIFVIHHMAIDGISWRILFEDLIDLYNKALTGSEFVQKVKPTSFIQWANTLQKHKSDARILSQLPYWQAITQTQNVALPTIESFHSDTYRNTTTIQFEIDKNETERLCTKAHLPYTTTVEELLLCALGRAIYTLHSIAATMITLESHGREEAFGLDLGRTCGWFTVTYPFLLSIHQDRNLAYQIKAVKESLRGVPDRGLGYGILKYLTPKEFTHNYNLACKPSIGFNYLGRIEDTQGGIFSIKPDTHSTAAINHDEKRFNNVDISGIIQNGILQMSLCTSADCYTKDSAIHFAELFKQEILVIIDHCCSRNDTELTPADFTYSDLTIDELEGII
jgi:non-ribosomal peptide synthase protein (TIGR01720 family)